VIYISKVRQNIYLNLYHRAWKEEVYSLYLHRKLVQKGKFAKQTYAVNNSVYLDKTK